MRCTCRADLGRELAAATVEGTMVVQFSDTVFEYDLDYRQDLALHLIRPVHLATRERDDA